MKSARLLLLAVSACMTTVTLAAQPDDDRLAQLQRMLAEQSARLEALRA